jgi:uncharacterized protein YjeT (DUF2065 family)
MLNKPNNLEGLLDLLYKKDWARTDLGGGIPALEEYKRAFRQMQRTPLNASNLDGYRWLLDPRAWSRLIRTWRASRFRQF